MSFGVPLCTSSPKPTSNFTKLQSQGAHYIIELSSEYKSQPTFALRRGNAVLPSNDYIGVRTRSEAEGFVPSMSKFRLYHQLADCRLPVSPELELFIVYRRENGICAHLRIETMTVLIDGEQRRMFRVESRRGARKTPPMFTTIQQLIKYYSTYVHLRRSSKTNQIKVEVFDSVSSPSESE